MDDKDKALKEILINLTYIASSRVFAEEADEVYALAKRYFSEDIANRFSGLMGEIVELQQEDMY